jgi:hypothetical protein
MILEKNYVFTSLNIILMYLFSFLLVTYSFFRDCSEFPSQPTCLLESVQPNICHCNEDSQRPMYISISLDLQNQRLLTSCHSYFLSEISFTNLCDVLFSPRVSRFSRKEQNLSFCRSLFCALLYATNELTNTVTTFSSVTVWK